MERQSIAFFKDGCVLHKAHVPQPAELHKHHIYPLGIANQNQWPTIAETVLVCPTGHINIHNRIKRLLRGEVIRGRPGKTGDYAHMAMEWINEHVNNNELHGIDEGALDSTDE